jgi:hypothetical protein
MGTVARIPLAIGTVARMLDAMADVPRMPEAIGSVTSHQMAISSDGRSMSPSVGAPADKLTKATTWTCASVAPPRVGAPAAIPDATTACTWETVGVVSVGCPADKLATATAWLPVVDIVAFESVGWPADTPDAAIA